MILFKSSLALLTCALLATPLHADRTLAKKGSEKVEIQTSMIGVRDTLVFYTFKEQRAVMVLSINNKDERFPIGGKVHLFDKAVDKSALKKWINNQHSDGLYADVPKPIYSGDLPKGICKVTAHKKTGKGKVGGPRPTGYTEFTVNLSVKDHGVDGKFKLSAFKDTARVFVPGK